MSIENLKARVLLGESFLTLKKDFPLLSEKSYRKLGGIPKAIENKKLGGIVPIGDYHHSGDTNLYSDLTKKFIDSKIFKPEPDWVIFNSTYGDGHLSIPNSVNPNAYYVEGHAIFQLPFLWYKAALLGDRLSRIRFKSQFGVEEFGNADDVGFIFSTSCPEATSAHKKFYTEENGNYIKCLDKTDLFEKFGFRELALWVMDDGGWSSGNKFSLSIGTSNRDPEYALRVSKILSSAINYEFKVTPSSKEGVCILPTSLEIHKKVAPYILPWFSYKLGLPPSYCGEYFGNKELEAMRELLSNYTHRVQDRWEELDLESRERVFLSILKVKGIPRGEKPSLEDLNALARNKVNTSGKEIKASHWHNGVCSWFFPNRYKVKCGLAKSPEEVLARGSRMRTVAKYQAKSGDSVKDSNIRNAVCMYGSKVAGQFNPIIARYLIETFCPIGGHVLDTCSGWGGRMLGAYLSEREYTGVEASIETHANLINFSDFLNKKYKIFYGDASDKSLQVFDKQYDLCITSPPYFNYEKYSKDDLQSHIKYPVFNDWVDGFLTNLIKNIYRSLKFGSYFVLNFGTILDLPEIATSIAKKEGFVLEDTLYSTPPGSYQRSLEYKELYLIFKKEVVDA